MANANGWGDGSVNNNIGWGQGANNITGWGKSQLSSWSGATDIDGGNLPVNSVAPAITGTAQEGQTLTCSTGTWSGSPTYTYQWKRNGSNIGSATNSTYTLVTADVGQSIKCTVTATNFIGSAIADSNTVVPTSSVDADAQAFITAASITDPTQQAAINTLVVDLKGYSIWSKMKAVYPFVGGTASTHKFNLKDPRDLDAAFRLVFNGGWTHSSTGATPNGTNGYADTKLTPNTVMNFNSQHYCIYKTTVQNTLACEFGVIVSYPSNYNGIQSFLKDGYGSVNDGLGNQFLSTTTAGNYILNRNNTNDKKLFRNGSLFDTKTSAPLNNILTNVFLGARNDNGAINWYSNTQTRFFSIGDGLTDTEAANFYTAVQAFQTTLGRQV